jgi:23S rRNA (adenine2030-N6)-methyltransferase
MKYRHGFHAGNFADVHKHVTVLALVSALQRKDKGFLYLETHAGAGDYGASEEADAGITRLDSSVTFHAEELKRYLGAVAGFRKMKGTPRAYPGSPVLATNELRAQDRAIGVEILPPEARALERALGPGSRMRVETGDGFERLRAHMPPTERRGLVLIDPPYEEKQDFDRVTTAVADAVRRFDSGVFCAWYPIKDERDAASWRTGFARAVGHEVLFSELWLYPRDSRVGLNGSGLAIVNPPYQIDERMKVWMPELHGALDSARTGGWSAETVSPAAAAR